MLQAIWYNLANLTRFTGRDARSTFWFYMLFLALLNVAVSFLLSIPLAARSVKAGISAAKSGVTPEQASAQVMGAMSGSMTTIAWIGAAVTVIQCALLAASFVRRLHDSGKPGWWALLALVIQLGALAYSMSMLGGMQAAFTSGDVAQIEGFTRQSRIGGLLNWTAPFLVVVFGVMGSTPGRNRYGEQPEPSRG